MITNIGRLGSPSCLRFLPIPVSFYEENKLPFLFRSSNILGTMCVQKYISTIPPPCHPILRNKSIYYLPGIPPAIFGEMEDPRQRISRDSLRTGKMSSLLIDTRNLFLGTVWPKARDKLTPAIQHEFSVFALVSQWRRQLPILLRYFTNLWLQVPLV